MERRDVINRFHQKAQIQKIAAQQSSSQHEVKPIIQPYNIQDFPEREQGQQVTDSAPAVVEAAPQSQTQTLSSGSSGLTRDPHGLTQSPAKETKSPAKQAKSSPNTNFKVSEGNLLSSKSNLDLVEAASEKLAADTVSEKKLDETDDKEQQDQTLGGGIKLSELSEPFMIY